MVVIVVVVVMVAVLCLVIIHSAISKNGISVWLMVAVLFDSSRGWISASAVLGAFIKAVIVVEVVVWTQEPSEGGIGVVGFSD